MDNLSNANISSAKHEFAERSSLPEGVQRDLCEVFAHWLRMTATLGWRETAHLMKRIDSDQTDFASTPANPPSTESTASSFAFTLMDPSNTLGEIGIQYSAIKTSDFAQCMHAMYDYGFRGLVDSSREAMEMDSTYTMIAALVLDLKRSHFAMEWDYLGSSIKESAERCCQIVEMANSRRILEGHGCFFYGSRDEESNDDDALSVRQLALLAGMEELSIRAAANPKRANPLPTFSADGRTRIAINVAKDWLIAKKKYTPITYITSGSNLDITNRRFKHRLDFYAALNSRFAYLAASRGPDLQAEARAIGWSTHVRGIDFEDGDIENFERLKALAPLLQIREELLVLKSKETLALESLEIVSYALKQIGQ